MDLLIYFRLLVHLSCSLAMQYFGAIICNVSQVNCWNHSRGHSTGLIFVLINFAEFEDPKFWQWIYVLVHIKHRIVPLNKQRKGIKNIGRALRVRASTFERPVLWLVFSGSSRMTRGTHYASSLKNTSEFFLLKDSTISKKQVRILQADSAG